MKCVITDQVVLLRAAEGPVAAYLGSFADFSSAQGYALYSIRRRVLLAAGFSRWLQQQSESRYFCESLFWASQPKQAAKT